MLIRLTGALFSMLFVHFVQRLDTTSMSVLDASMRDALSLNSLISLLVRVPSEKLTDTLCMPKSASQIRLNSDGFLPEIGIMPLPHEAKKAQLRLSL